MSLKKHKGAMLDGYGNPQFPACLQTLAIIQQAFGGLAMTNVSTLVPGFKKVELNVITSDDYEWHAAWFFQVEEGIICLLKPWDQDLEKIDGFQSDRSMAIHVSSPAISKDQIREIIGIFAQKTVEYYLERSNRLEDQNN